VIITLVGADPTYLQDTIPHAEGCAVKKKFISFSVPADEKCAMGECNYLGRRKTYYYECLRCERTSDILTEWWMCIDHQPPRTSVEPAITITRKSTVTWQGVSPADRGAILSEDLVKLLQIIFFCENVADQNIFPNFYNHFVKLLALRIRLKFTFRGADKPVNCNWVSCCEFLSGSSERI
jgi:hypothetical protein